MTMEKLTSKLQSRHDGNKCPLCRSSYIDRTDSLHFCESSGYMFADWKCQDCKTEWTEAWTFVYTEIRELGHVKEGTCVLCYGRERSRGPSFVELAPGYSVCPACYDKHFVRSRR